MDILKSKIRSFIFESIAISSQQDKEFVFTSDSGIDFKFVKTEEEYWIAFFGKKTSKGLDTHSILNDGNVFKTLQDFKNSIILLYEKSEFQELRIEGEYIDNEKHTNILSKRSKIYFNYLSKNLPENFSVFLLGNVIVIKTEVEKDYLNEDYSRDFIMLYEAKKSEFEKLKDSKVPLTPEERKEVFKRKAVWHSLPNGKACSAVWKSKNKKTGKITYITHTHRAYNTAKSLKAIINKFHNFIKSTA